MRRRGADRVPAAPARRPGPLADADRGRGSRRTGSSTLQISGPYALWHHTHEFEPDGDGDRDPRPGPLPDRLRAARRPRSARCSCAGTSIASSTTGGSAIERLLSRALGASSLTGRSRRLPTSSTSSGPMIRAGDEHTSRAAKVGSSSAIACTGSRVADLAASVEPGRRQRRERDRQHAGRRLARGVDVRGPAVEGPGPRAGARIRTCGSCERSKRALPSSAIRAIRSTVAGSSTGSVPTTSTR